MIFNKLKMLNIMKRIDWHVDHVPKPINDRVYPDLTLAQSSSNTRYIYDDNNKLIVVPKYINNHSFIDKRTMYLKATRYTATSFSEMTHYK